MLLKLLFTLIWVQLWRLHFFMTIWVLWPKWFGSKVVILSGAYCINKLSKTLALEYLIY